MSGTLYNGTKEEDAARIAAEKAAKNSAMGKTKDSIAAGGDPLWGDLYDVYGTPGAPASETGNYGQAANDASDYANWVKLNRERETKKNLGYSTPEEAWDVGMSEGPDAWAAAEARRWGKTAAPEMWNAAGQRATRGASLDDLTQAMGGGLSADLQGNIRREAAAQAAASGSGHLSTLTGKRGGAQAGLVAAQQGIAGQGMQEGIRERGARAESLSRGLASGRSQELAEAARMQDWSLKREALRQKLLGMGLQQKNRRYDLLGDYIRANQANSMEEYKLAMNQRAADKAREAGYIQTGAQTLQALGNLIPKGGDDSSSADEESGGWDGDTWGTDDESGLF